MKKQQVKYSQKAIAAKQTVAKKAAARPLAEKQHRGQSVVAGERHRMIAEAAYHIAEQRGFQGDMAMADWLQAEMELNARFTTRH